MPTYLDYNATTPLDPAVLEVMQPYLTGPYGNPSSVHRYGRAARDAIEAARAQVARLVGCESGEVFWTSGATESNNMAIKGVAYGRPQGRVLYGATEHPAVLEAAEALRDEGWPVETIAMAADGLIDWSALAAQLPAGPVRLVAVMVANNETGVIQDIPRVAAQVHAAGAWLLADAVQAAGKIPLDFAASGADLMSLSAHKLYGPKGVGALIRRAQVELRPLMHGGGQEHGLRGGTENLAGIVGFGAAAALAAQQLETRRVHLQGLQERLEAQLRTMAGVRIFGDGAPRLPNTVQFAVPGWEGEALLMMLDRKGFAVSSGSACASGRGEPSHVLLGMGIARHVAYGAVRVSFGVQSVAADVDRFMQVLRDLCTATAV